MTIKEIQDLLEREPFQPFRIILTSGTIYDILSSRSAMPLKRELFIALQDGETWTIVPFIHIAAIEKLKAA